MYVETFESFSEQAVALFRSNPLKARFVTKYRHCDGKLVLKVTDDSTVSCCGRAAHAACRQLLLARAPHAPHTRPSLQCLQYKTDQQADLKKIEKLNRVFFALMATGEAPPGVCADLARNSAGPCSAPAARASGCVQVLCHRLPVTFLPADDAEMHLAEQQLRQKTRKG